MITWPHDISKLGQNMSYAFMMFKTILNDHGAINHEPHGSIGFLTT